MHGKSCLIPVTIFVSFSWSPPIVLCPILADPHFIITANNYDSLLLSNYNRTNGTEVKVTCLSYSSHQLIGSSLLKCLDTGQWDRSIPACVPRTDDGANGNSTGEHFSLSLYTMFFIITSIITLTRYENATL